MKAKGREADTEVEFLEMKWSAGQDSHHLCLWPAESVLSSPAGRWRWTVLLWSILVQSPGHSSCTGPSWLWIVPEWERKRWWSEEEKSSDSVWRSWGTDSKMKKISKTLQNIHSEYRAFFFEVTLSKYEITHTIPTYCTKTTGLL